jgi:hypothetical protein
MGRPLAKLTAQDIRLVAESNLEAFIRLVHPGSVLGAVHVEAIQWMTASNKRSHQLLLLPRDHQKSRLAAYYVAWKITQNPALRVLYVSSTSNLATKQLKFIKDIFTSSIYKKYWPEMVNEDIGSREKWTESEISVDHPKRRSEAVRDPTVFTAGLTTNITGLHCDLAVLDDLVEPNNAYTDQGRETVKNQYSQLASIEGADAEELVVGTRYFPTDLYFEMAESRIEVYGDDGELVSEEPLYEIFLRQVEDVGDGTGNFLWPRQQRRDGKWFGFDSQILAKKKAQYRDKTQFRAQYYNDPTDTENALIQRDMFQYFDPKKVYKYDGRWYCEGRRLNVFASVDFAFSTKKRADFSTVIVVGVDSLNNIYVLDIDRFKTNLISDYFTHILKLHQKWEFRKLRAEVVSAQKTIVEDLKINYIRPHGLALSIDEHAPNSHTGTKEERILAALQARYANGNIWHAYGVNTTALLEEELIQVHPPHDDIKDALASVVEIAVAPTAQFGTVSNMRLNRQMSYNKFGGIL